jgi:rRNA processing protein Krr1/Pno1
MSKEKTEYEKFKALDNKAMLLDIQRDHALYSKLRDRLVGQDAETDELLEEIQKLQLEIMVSVVGEVLA